MSLSPLDPAPNLTLTTLTGEAYPLARTWSGGRGAVLVFLRHLG